MKDYPKVSVAIGTWNRFEMVSEAIQAVLDQTYPVYEVVVFDDCSPDNSYERLKEKYCNEPRVKVFKQTKNTGGVPNWNAAINACSGEYIAWCSDDDRFFSDHIQYAVGYLEEHPDIGMVHSEFASVFENGSTRRKFNKIDGSILSQVHIDSRRFNEPYQINADNFFEYYLKYFNWPFHPSTMVFRKTIWAEVGEFDPDYELSDSDWYIRVAGSFKIVYLPHFGVLNRRHEGNWSSRMGTANMQDEFFDMIYKYLDRPAYFSTFEKRALLKKRWENFHFKLMLRIYIAKKRRGEHGEAMKVSKMVESNFYGPKILIFRIISALMSPFSLIKGK